MTDLPAVEPDELEDVAPQENIFEPVEAEVPPAPLPYESPFTHLKMTWYGTDGSEWHLDDPSTGVFLVQEGIEGLHNPLTDEVNRTSPSIPGSRFHGYRVKERDVIWAIYIYSDESSLHWYDLNDRFWNSMKIGQYGKWRVTKPDGSYRELSMRQVPTAFAHERDPGKFGWVKYPVRFIADEDPFWTHPYEVPGSQVTFESEPEDNFFGGSDGRGPSFHLSASRARSDRSVFNNGDEDVDPVITVTGPMDFVDFSIGERTYHLECDLLQGEWIKIDTTPHRFSITDSDGKNRMESIDNWIFDPFPSKETTPITVYPQGIGGGSVVIDASPLYHRGF